MHPLFYILQAKETKWLSQYFVPTLQAQTMSLDLMLCCFAIFCRVVVFCVHFWCFICWGKMHGVGMQEKRARGVVSSARWSHGRPMDWDGLEDSQAFWATSGRNTYISVLHHIVFSLQLFNATMHFALYYFVKEIMFKCIIKLQSIASWCSSGGWDTSHWPRRVTTGHSTLSLPSPTVLMKTFLTTVISVNMPTPWM